MAVAKYALIYKACVVDHNHHSTACAVAYEAYALLRLFFHAEITEISIWLFLLLILPDANYLHTLLASFNLLCLEIMPAICF